MSHGQRFRWWIYVIHSQLMWCSGHCTWCRGACWYRWWWSASYEETAWLLLMSLACWQVILNQDLAYWVYFYNVLLYFCKGWLFKLFCTSYTCMCSDLPFEERSDLHAVSRSLSTTFCSRHVLFDAHYHWHMHALQLIISTQQNFTQNVILEQSLKPYHSWLVCDFSRIHSYNHYTTNYHWAVAWLNL